MVFDYVLLNDTTVLTSPFVVICTLKYPMYGHTVVIVEPELPDRDEIHHGRPWTTMVKTHGAIQDNVVKNHEIAW